MSQTTSHQIRLGTRGSALARWQADWVTSRLEAIGVAVERVLITTGGDVSRQPIKEVGGQGLFTKEIQRALLDGRIDIAVHSLKDLPTEPVPELVLAAVPEREDPHDALVSRDASGLDNLGTDAKIGTGSPRRQAQLLYYRSDLQMLDIRGNVDTRLSKLDAGEFDAIVLATAGLLRLGLAERITQRLSFEIMLPAVGQGALGIECRADDAKTIQAVAALNHGETRACVIAERALLASLRGGCLAPVAAHARVESDVLHLNAAVLSVDGQQRLAAATSGSASEPRRVGESVARQLTSEGAGTLISASRA